MHATIVLNDRAGRALRRQRAAVCVGDVLWCSGDFRVGDPVWLSFCATDGGQYAVARGIVGLDGADLRHRLPALSAAGGATPCADDDAVLVALDDVRALWN